MVQNKQQKIGNSIRITRNLTNKTEKTIPTRKHRIGNEILEKSKPYKIQWKKLRIYDGVEWNDFKCTIIHC